ncbi:MAG: 50S ribosomal protein L20 [Candidatus Zixiibacteriota bacterium]|nr:MAG: 50S ribosomal protein L20 [candidate division Zixibacteria bacterium]
MPRAKNKVTAHRRHKRILKKARGNYGARSRLYRTALETVQKGMKYAYRDRRNRKREFRRLWVTRISAGARQFGLNYSAFISGLKKAGIGLDRKALADIAARDSATFGRLVEMAKNA